MWNRNPFSLAIVYNTNLWFIIIRQIAASKSVQMCRLIATHNHSRARHNMQVCGSTQSDTLHVMHDLLKHISIGCMGPTAKACEVGGKRDYDFTAREPYPAPKKTEWAVRQPDNAPVCQCETNLNFVFGTAPLSCTQKHPMHSKHGHHNHSIGRPVVQDTWIHGSM
jgi:hypothetical protein